MNTLEKGRMVEEKEVRELWDLKKLKELCKGTSAPHPVQTRLTDEQGQKIQELKTLKGVCKGATVRVSTSTPTPTNNKNVQLSLPLASMQRNSDVSAPSFVPMASHSSVARRSSQRLRARLNRHRHDT